MDEPIPIQRLAAWGLRGLAVLALVGGVLATVVFWTLAWNTRTIPWPLAAVVPIQILFAAAVVAWVLLLWRRARMLSSLVAQDYPAITCVAACTRLMGELFAILFVLLSLALSVASLASTDVFAGAALAQLDLQGDIVEPATYGVAAVVALMWFMAGLFAAGLTLFGSYLFAEALTAMLDYVRDVRRIRENLESECGPRHPA